MIPTDFQRIKSFTNLKLMTHDASTYELPASSILLLHNQKPTRHVISTGNAKPLILLIAAHLILYSNVQAWREGYMGYLKKKRYCKYSSLPLFHSPFQFFRFYIAPFCLFSWFSLRKKKKLTSAMFAANVVIT